MNWIFLSLLAAFLWAFVNVVDKYVMSKLEIKPIVPIIISGFFGLFTALGIYFSRGYQPLSLVNTLLGLSGGLLFMLMVYFYFRALQTAEVSRVVPLFYLSPILIAIMAAFTLGEVFTPLTYVGILLLALGAILISSDKPFSFKFSPAFWFMIGAAVLISFEQILTKYLLGLADY